jgi:hypothetical protein
VASYVDSEAFKSSMSIIGTFSQSDVEMALSAASRAVERVTHRRTFLKDSSPTTRTYSARTTTAVSIDDAASITQVQVNGSTVTDYLAHPLNAPADGRPYTWLKSASGVFDASREGAITVTGLFGWPAVPDEVPQMVTILASKLLKRTREAPFGIVTVGGLDGGALQMATTDPDMKLLCKPLTRQLVGWR